MHVDITTQPRLRVAAVHHVGPYNRISEAFARLGGIAGRAGLFGPGAMMIGVYHDDPRTTPETQLRSDAGVTLSDSAKIPDALTEVVIPAGRYARTTHVGPYDALPGVWKQLMGEWLPDSGHRDGDGPSYELYRNNPMNTKPQDLVTEIYVPLK